jgi:hypothetical protein
MHEETLQARVRELHATGASTNRIARDLGVPRGRVAPLMRAIGREERASTAEPALIGCWVSAGWSAGLTVAAPRDWPDRERSGTMPVSGLVGVLVARAASRRR